MGRVKWNTPYFKVWDGNSNEFWKGWCSPVNGIDEMYCGNVRALIFLRPTGLKDKNGIEIYEGDILEFITFGFDSERFITYIEFINASFRLKNGRSLFYFGQKDVSKLDDGRVIGNIYENPELLENK